MKSGKRRKNHEGTFRKLPSGRWEGAQRVAGIERPVSVTGDTEAKARKALAEKIAAILSNQTLPKTAKVAFKVYAEQVIRERGGIGQRTRDKYTFELNNYLEPLHERRLASITASEIRALYAGLRERNLSVAVIGHAHALLNIIFSTAKVDKLVAQNPLDGARLRPKALKGEQREPNVYLPDQARLILQYAPKVIHGDAIALLLLTGMRRGEALALRWTDVDWEGNAPRNPSSGEESLR